MQISWITPFSLIDYPWKVSCIVFSPGCNFRCSYCHNSEFVVPEKLKNVYKNLISETSFFNFLEKRKWLLDWVSICWGEPTLQNDLYDFCKKIKKMWYKLKLDTNWRDPEVLKLLIDDGLIDYIAMDIKNEIWKFSESAWVELNEKPYLESINIILNSNIDYEFRTTVISGVHTDENIENIAKYISWAKNYYLQNFKSWNTLEKWFKWKSFSIKELNYFRNLSLKFVKNVWIRN